MGLNGTRMVAAAFDPVRPYRYRCTAVYMYCSLESCTATTELARSCAPSMFAMRLMHGPPLLLLPLPPLTLFFYSSLLLTLSRAYAVNDAAQLLTLLVPSDKRGVTCKV